MRINYKGNALLELVLFIPLALFFLFITIDAGLSLVQRAGIQDSFRSGINSLPAFAKEHGPSAQTTNLVAQEISNNLSNQFSLYPNANNNYYVNTTLYELEMNANTGALDTYTQVSNIEIGSINSGNTLKNFTAKADFVSSRLSATSTTSKYAEPALYKQNNNASSNQLYKSRSYILYSEVRAIPVGINSSYLSSTLGGLYSIQAQQLELVRDY